MDIAINAIFAVVALLFSILLILLVCLCHFVFKWLKESNQEEVEVVPVVGKTKKHRLRGRWKLYFRLALRRVKRTSLIHWLAGIRWRRHAAVRSRLAFRKVRRSKQWHWLRENPQVQFQVILFIIFVIVGGLWLDHGIWEGIAWVKAAYFTLYNKLPVVTWWGVLAVVIGLLILVSLVRSIYLGKWRTWPIIRGRSSGSSHYRYSASTPLLFLFLFILIFGLYVKDAGWMGEKKVLAVTDSKSTYQNSVVIRNDNAGVKVIHNIAFSEGEPYTLYIESGHRFDVIDTTDYRKTWGTYDKGVDASLRRIQIFEVLPSAKKVALQVAVTKCLPGDCKW